jgi:predicted KAP-like P-loop ATPase
MLIPDQETAVDFLNYEAIALTIVEILKENRSRALTIGVHGDWGAGKSSVLKMVEAGLSGDKKVACLWFNGWTFEGFDDAKTVLIEATITELARQRSTTGKVKDLAAGLIRRLDWFKLARRGGGLAFTLLTGMPSPDMLADGIAAIRSLAKKAKDVSPAEFETAVDEAASYFKPGEAVRMPDQVHQFREEFKALLAEAQIDQLVVLIDDLDRCLPKTAIETLEAIRLFLFVPKTAFVIGADEAMIEYAVKHHFPDLPPASGPTTYARNYLEKLIQLPFRVPALGVEESRTYVTLLLVESLTGDAHEGFKSLLSKGRAALNRPWEGKGLARDDVRSVDTGRQSDLDRAFTLAQQIGPILAEGTKGNPRQIKRFLNALMMRQAIATARGFGSAINQSALGKLMLAERFQSDFYDFAAARAMASVDGKVPELATLEGGLEANKKPAGTKDAIGTRSDPADELTSEISKWAGREWLQRWARLDPPLRDIDLRPYVFVARDKRVLTTASDASGLDLLIERLMGSDMAVRMTEGDVKALSATVAEDVFSGLKHKVQSHGSLKEPPPGFAGLSFVAKHHPQFQRDLVGLFAGQDPTSLGIWVVKGWGASLTDDAANRELQAQLVEWSKQNENPLLKTAAVAALKARAKGTS